jgi:acyl-CoA dehydrogenase
MQQGAELLRRSTEARSPSTALAGVRADRLARARIDLELVAAYLHVVTEEVERSRRSGVGCGGTPQQIHLNALKVAAAELTLRATDRLLDVVGLEGYRRDAGLGVERALRDLRSASLNFSNDRLTVASGRLALLDRRVTFASD